MWTVDHAIFLPPIPKKVHETTVIIGIVAHPTLGSSASGNVAKYIDLNLEECLL
jgi:hypothetical protein